MQRSLREIIHEIGVMKRRSRDQSGVFDAGKVAGSSLSAAYTRLVVEARNVLCYSQRSSKPLIDDIDFITTSS